LKDSTETKIKKPLSDVHKAGISAGVKRYFATHETHLTDEHKAKLAEANRRRTRLLKAQAEEIAALKKLLEELKENEKTPTE